MKSRKRGFIFVVIALLLSFAWSKRGAGWSFVRHIVVAESGREERIETLGYSCNQDEYLVVWSVDAGGGDMDLWARRARSRPTFSWLGAAFSLAATSAPERAAALAFDPLNEDFLVVFERELTGGDVDVMGQWVAGRAGGGDNGGQLKGDSFTIAASPASETQPAIAFLPATQQFLVVYVMQEDIWAQRVARRNWGDDGGQLLGEAFVVAADFSWAETQPAVAAGTLQSYFMVAYAYEFGPDDFDVRGQRVKGEASTDPLIGDAFDIAFANETETRPALRYSQEYRAFLAAWQADAAGASDVFGAWLDESTTNGDPALGAPFAIAADPVMQESHPRLAIDPITGDAAVALQVAAYSGARERLGLVWLKPDPRGDDAIARPLFQFPQRAYAYKQPRLALCPNQGEMLLGYRADPGGPGDAHLLAVGRWSTALPLAWRSQ
ncbi:MAG: hypothetical protein GXP42_05235 [Chloroflexi bacterium]|nr:hypothetical protein [Chloroflexota bacterium]